MALFAFPLATAVNGALGMSESIWAILASAVVVFGAVAAFMKWIRPRLHNAKSDVVAIRDSMIGREEIRDSITGALISPALPGIGVRMDSQERQMAVLTGAVAKIADSHVRIDSLVDAQEALKARVSKLEQAAVERIVNHQESAAAFRAIEAAQLADPPVQEPTA